MTPLLLALTIVACGGIEDTAALQHAVNAGDVRVSGDCRVNGNVGVRIPSSRALALGTATFTMQPACSPMCKVFETVPDSVDIDIDGGTFHGDQSLACSSCWRNFVRVDKSRRVRVRRGVYRDSFTDAVWVGGNGSGSMDVVLSELDIRGSRRNGISVTNGSGVTIERSYIGETAAVTILGAGVNVEPNAGESVRGVVIRANTFHGNRIGVYVHRGKGVLVSDAEISRNRITNSGTHGAIVNAVERAAVFENDIENAPIGLNIGSHTEASRSYDILTWRNRITAVRPLVLAGIRDSRLFDDDLHGGRPEAAALGTTGRMSLEPYVEQAPPVCE